MSWRCCAKLFLFFEKIMKIVLTSSVFRCIYTLYTLESLKIRKVYL